MKIGIITPWVPNGYASLSMQLAQYFQILGHEVQILPWRDDHHDLFDHGEEPEWFNYRGNNVETFFYNFKPDYCVLMMHCDSATIDKAVSTGVKLIPLMMWENYKGWITQLSRCHKVVMTNRVSTAYAQQFNSNVHCVPWCLQGTPVSPSQHDVKPVRLLYVANMPHPRRRGDYTFRAVHNLLRQDPSSVQLTVRWIMQLYERDQESFQDLYEEYGPSVEVTAGFNSRRSLMNDYRKADILLYPSEYDGLGLTPMEAQQAGCNVLAFDSDPLRETIYPGADLVNLGNGELGETKEGITTRTPTYNDWFCALEDIVYGLQQYKDRLNSWQSKYVDRQVAFDKAWQEILV